MRVLVPVNDDVNSRRAVPEAARLAGESGELVLASVGELPEVGEHREEIREALSDRLAQAAAGVDGVPIRTRIEHANDPVDGIAAIAEEERIDQVVLVDDDGDVSDRLREQLNIPIMVVSSIS